MAEVRDTPRRAATRETRILQPGRNCWRIEHADRVAFLVDGAEYFAAFKAAVEQARHSVFILGWEIDSRLRLTPDAAQAGVPDQLADFLGAVVRRRPGLNVYILVWDYAMIYAAERQWLPIFHFAWRTSRKVHFHADNGHPLGASHHQKIVVVDDALAFVGGFDLSKSRWDTSEHRADDPRRTDPTGTRYLPFHDVQILVQGAAAAALGELARARWRSATGKNAVSARAGDPAWPYRVRIDLERVEVAIARTSSQYGDEPEVREVERLYVDSIRAARRWIYVENQYFTSNTICSALAERLRAPQGPEIVLVLPRASGGWLEQKTMDVLRHRVLSRLHEADTQGRLAVYYPIVPGLRSGCLNMHSKIMVIDDRLVRVGSSNLSNRSMGFDSECDLAVELPERDERRAAARFRDRLLAEHLGLAPHKVAAELDRTGSLIATIENLRDGERSLEPLVTHISPSMDSLIPDGIDPERPIAPEELARRLVPPEEASRSKRRLFLLLGLLAVMLALTAAWHWTPLADKLSPRAVLRTLQTVSSSPAAPAVTLAIYTLGCLISVPVTLLIIATMLVFNPLVGIVYALLGALLGACATYGVGYALGRDSVRRLVGSRLNRVSTHLAEHAVLTVIILRLIPIAPYTVVNIVAGASHIRFRDFVLGTVIGMAPAIIAIGVLLDRLRATLYQPSAAMLGGLASVTIGIGFAVFALRWWLIRRRRHRNAT